jgi:ATP-binding cassette subfamily B protein
MVDTIEKLKIFYQDLKKVSHLTKTKGKKVRLLVLALIVNIVAGLDILIILYFTSFLTFEYEIENNILQFLILKPEFLPLIVVARFLFIYIERIIITNLQYSIEKNLRIYLINEVFKRGNISTGDAYYYTTTIAGQVGNFYSTLAAFIASIFQILFFSIYLIASNLTLILVFGFGSFILIIPTFYLTKKGRSFAHNTYTVGGSISGLLEKIIDNFFLIKILNMSQNEIKHYKNTLNKFYQSRLNEIKVGTLNAILPNFITMIFLAILLVFFNLKRYITLDFIGILLRLFQSLGNMNKNIHTVSAFHVYLEKLYEIEKNKVSVYPENYVVNKYKLSDEIAIKIDNISFKYLGTHNNLFEDINLVFYKNKHTIITGFNGSGKSTLLGLATGIYYPQKGKVISFSKNIGYVSANPMIINGTIKENLIYGNNNENILDVEMREYINEFQVFQDNENINLNKKINNKSLSMGQMQKISFIRALLSGLDILILDESTSNLDTDSKALIYKILKKNDLTIINATHSPEDFMGFDHHIKIEEGKTGRTVTT